MVPVHPINEKFSLYNPDYELSELQKNSIEKHY